MLKDAIKKENKCTNDGFVAHVIAFDFYEYQTYSFKARVRNIMMTSWHGNSFRIVGPLWGESIGDHKSQ